MQRLPPTTHVVAMFLLCALLALPVAAQTIPRDPVPEPLPELPSVSEYSLPPGEDTSSNTSPVEGPVEENAPPPVAVPTDGTGAQAGPVVSGTPIPSTPMPSPNEPALTTTPSTSAVPANNQPERIVPSRATQQTATPSAPVNNFTRRSPGGINAGPEPGFSFDSPENIGASESQADPTPPIDNPAPTIKPVNDSNTVVLILSSIGLMLVLGAGFILWRRRNISSSNGANQAFEESEPLPDVPLAPTQNKPEQKTSTPPKPIEKPEQSPAMSDGFVTSKIATKPAPVDSSTAVQNFGAARPRRWDHLHIDFVAEGAASTLLNAVLTYRIVMTNKSGEMLTMIELAGAMTQADDQSRQNDRDDQGTPLHQIANLGAGESVKLSGEIRLPLQEIKPITVRSQALFIPLARFTIAYRDGDEIAHQQQVAFVIGQEHEPPRAKMAPFRLDLGPRRFTDVGQRPLLTGS